VRAPHPFSYRGQERVEVYLYSLYGPIGVYRILVGKAGKKRPLGRPRRRWEDNIKIDLQEVGCEGMDLFKEVEGLRFQDNRHMMVVGCQPCAPAAFTPTKCSWYSFLLETESTPGP